MYRGTAEGSLNSAAPGYSNGSEMAAEGHEIYELRAHEEPVEMDGRERGARYELGGALPVEMDGESSVGRTSTRMEHQKSVGSMRSTSDLLSGGNSSGASSFGSPQSASNTMASPTASSWAMHASLYPSPSYDRCGG